MCEGVSPVKISKKLLTAFVVATLAGTVLHFLYNIFPNPVTALLSPVNESLWEHLKILFWPYLVSLLVLTRGGAKGVRTPWMLTLLMMCGAMLGLGWLYHITLGGEALFVDVALYVLLMAAGFVLPGIFHPLSGRESLGGFLTLAVIALGVALFIFTFLPPDGLLFLDLSGVHTWVTIPC